MAYRVLIPTPLRPYTGQQDAVEFEGGTVGEILSALTSRYADLRRHLYADDGKLRHFVNVYVNDDDIRYLDREATALKSGDVISIVPSVAGGAPVTEAAATPELTNAEVERYSRHLILPEVGIRRTAAAESGPRAVCRCRRTWIACGVVPGGCRRRHDRHHRFRCRRCQQPATADPARHARCRAIRSCSRLAIGCRRSIPKSESRRTRRR